MSSKNSRSPVPSPPPSDKPRYVYSWRLSQWELSVPYDAYLRCVKRGYPPIVRV